MHITHSYIGSVQGNSRYSFYLLYEDYIEAQSEFAQDFDLLLERFARNIGHSGVVVRPFLGDVEATKSHIPSFANYKSFGGDGLVIAEQSH